MSRLDGAGGSSAILTRHFLQVPCPPQVESMAMPFQLAASNRVTPYGTRTVRSLKTRLTRTGWVAASSAAVTSALTLRAGWRCRFPGRFLRGLLLGPVRGD